MGTSLYKEIHSGHTSRSGVAGLFENYVYLFDKFQIFSHIIYLLVTTCHLFFGWVCPFLIYVCVCIYIIHTYLLIFSFIGV